MTQDTSNIIPPVLRDAGAAFGIFGLLNVIGEFVRGPFDVLRSFVGVPEFLHSYAIPFEAVVATLLLLHRFRPFQSRATRAFARTMFGLMALFSVVDIVGFYRVVFLGIVQTSVPVPGSILVCAFFAAMAWDVGQPRQNELWTGRPIARLLTTSAVVVAALPLLLMFTFGPTNYARPADCAVVFGARVWDDGTPSLALSDRVDEGIRLHQNRLVRKIIMSGAIDKQNGHSEPEVMKKRAVLAGVPAEDILLDEVGIDTSSTARNTAVLMHTEGLRSALAVSHYYHEPRVKMLFARAGIRVYTVPAKMTRRLLKEPLFVAREILAYYHSWLFQ